MSFLGSLYAAAATNPKRCSHKHVIVLGSEETGLRSLYCERCRTPMERYVFKGQYVYRPIGSRQYKARRRSKKRSLTGIGPLDRLFMAAAPALAPESRPFKPVRKAKAARVKLLTTAKTPLGSRHFERVAEIGPYVPGFYVVKNVDGRAVVYRRSAVEMRRYPAHLGYPCP